MKRFAPALLAMALSGAVAAPVPLSAPTGFSTTVTSDLFGYYLPSRDVLCGKFKLTMIAVGPTEDFANFEHGERWNGDWAPILLEFAPASAVQKPGPEGGTDWEGSFRVLPTAYRVSNDAIVFTGRHKLLGTVIFNGRIDAATLKHEQSQSNSGSRKIVVTGELTVGKKTISDVTFTWSGGD